MPKVRYWPPFLPCAGFLKDVEEGRRLGNQLLHAPSYMKRNEDVPSFLFFSSSSLMMENKRDRAAWAATATSQGGIE